MLLIRNKKYFYCIENKTENLQILKVSSGLNKRKKNITTSQRLMRLSSLKFESDSMINLQSNDTSSDFSLNYKIDHAKNYQ